MNSRSLDGAFMLAQIRVLGGAVARVPVDPTAFAHRRSKILVNCVAGFSAADAPAHVAWVKRFAASLRQTDRGADVGSLEADALERLREAYPGPNVRASRRDQASV